MSRSAYFAIAVLIGFSFVISVSIIEVGFRTIVPQRLVRPCTEPHPSLGTVGSTNCTYHDNWNKKFYTYQVSHNNLGFRMPHDVSLGDVNSVRILTLGDSFTYGWGVEEHQSYVGLLRRELTQLDSKIEVINLGVGAYSTGHHRKQLESWVPRLKPSAVIIYLNNNDLKDNLIINPNYATFSIEQDSNGHLKELKPRLVFSPFKRWLQANTPHHWLNQHSHAYVGIRAILKPKANDTDAPSFTVTDKFDTAKNLLTRQVTLRHFKAIFTSLSEKGIPVRIVWIPNACKLTTGQANEKLPCLIDFEKFLEELQLLTNEFPLVSLQDPTVELGTETLSLASKEIYFDEGHFTPRGNKLFHDFTVDPLRSWLTQTLTNVREASP